MGRRTVLLLAATALAVLLSSGVALALNTIDCEERAERCVGTDRADLMRGTDRDDLMFGRDKGDTLKGFGGFDALLGQKGDDRLFGGARQDFVIGGPDDDKLRGEDALDIYFFERSNWGQDTIFEESPSRNLIFLPFRRGFTGPVTTNMNSGPLPEVTNAASGSTVNWAGDVIFGVGGSSGDDTITGTERADDIFDEAGPITRTGADTDALSGGGGGDFLFVEDGDGDDTVTCGGGNDTVFFDEGDTLVDAAACEEQNPPRPERQQRATTYRAQALEEAPDAVLEGYRP